MASTPPLGPSWPPCCSKRGLSSFISRTGLWHCTHFVASSSPTEQSPADYIKQLQSSTPPPSKSASYAEAVASVSDKLLKGEYMYVQRGGVVPPLAPLYHGPYKVLEAGKKFFTISLRGREDTISVDRLKTSSWWTCGSCTTSSQRSSSTC